MLITILSFVFVFTILAVAHEGGHFLLARRAGMRVHEFGIGFGPTLFSFKRGNTVYSLNAVPFLAFVRIAGADTEGDGKDDLSCPDNEKFYNKSVKERALSLAAGPLANLLVASLVFWLVFSISGIPKTISNEIDIVKPNSEASRVGLKSGDIIVSINGYRFMKMEALIDRIHRSPGFELTLGVSRGGREFLVKVTPVLDKKLKIGLIGFTPKTVYDKVNPIIALFLGIQQTLMLSGVTVFFIGKLFIGGVSLNHLAGPVGIAQITGQYAQSGFMSLLYFLAFLNINIGILNLVPLPAFDGGRLFFLLIESIRKKPVSQALENRIHQVGLTLLLILMVLVTINDILRMMAS